MYPETAADSADYRQLLDQRLVRPTRLELWMADADGGNARQVTSLGARQLRAVLPSRRTADHLRVELSGRRGAATSTSTWSTLDGTGLEQVTTSGEFDGFPMFSPDGTKLVFASNRHAAEPGETNIFIADWVE